MASDLRIYLMLLTCRVAEVTSVSKQGQFPLKDCLGDDTDLLSLLDYDLDQTWVQQHHLTSYLYYELSRLTSQLAVATVVDQFNAVNETTNICDWRFNTFQYDGEPFMMGDTDTLEVPIIDLRTRLKMKVEVVKRLFAEMSGVRLNAVHVAVIFLDGKNMTQEEIGNVPSIVQNISADIKIFTVIFGSKLTEEIVHMTDTLVLPDKDLSYFDQYLSMAICKQCYEGWVLFEHKNDVNMLSCYGTSIVKDSWNNAMSNCNKYYNGYLAVIETIAEMIFVQKQIWLKLKESNSSDVQFHIGLRRDLNNYAKRFMWMTNPTSFRPLLIQHWLPGQPCRECINNDCVLWNFTDHWAHDNDSNNTLQNDTYVKNTTSEGWVNVNCHAATTSAALCEVALPRRINEVNFISSIGASTTDTNVTKEKVDFVIYAGNIVSMSANVPNPNFRNFLINSEIDFPIFDCGEDASDPRYISFNMVCDFFDHCSNKRDELLCLNPREYSDYRTYCTSGQMLYSEENKCDNVKDCRDGSDEENCFDTYCTSVRCQDGSCLPLQWVNDGEFDCFIFTTTSSKLMVSDEVDSANFSLANNNSCVLSCNSDQCIEESQLSKWLKDCIGLETYLADTLGKPEPANTCKNSFGNFIWAPKCHYIKDRYGGIVGCRDMSHLIDCENFQCLQGYVKCYNSYCIPHYYLRDGRTDCPTGEDEQPFYTGPCTGYFACWNSNICLHPALLCDGHPECPYGDDELGCREFCPKGFRCISGTVSLTDYNRSIPLDMTTLSRIDPRPRYMDLSGIEIYGFDNFMPKTREIFYNLLVLIMSNCKLSKLYIPYDSKWFGKNPPFSIQKLDISYNMFEQFSKHYYNHYYKRIHYLNMSYNKQLKSVGNLRFGFLEILDFSYTSLSYLNDSVFVNLPRLKHLNLSHTLISDFTRQYFRSKASLHTLDLRRIHTKDLDDYLFHGLTISQELYVDHFKICCPQIQGLVIKPRACIAPVTIDAISSCSNLLGFDIQRFLLWMVAILAVLGNVTVIVYRVTWDRSVLQTGYGLFVTNLGISDFIMGVYLFIIAGADSFYRDKYVLYDKSWRNSVECKIAGFMACLSCEASTFFVFLITLDRFLVIKFPFGQIKFRWYHKTIAVVMSWVASVLLSIAPIVLNFDIYSSNAMCLGLPLTNSQAKGWEYCVAVFIIFNLIMFVFIACGQYAIFRAISENRISKTAANMISSRRAEDITVAKQLSLVVLSNFLFWFPVGIMGLMSLGGHEVSSEVYAWTTVLLLPINSAANPVLYTIPALLDRWEQFRRGDQRTPSASV